MTQSKVFKSPLTSYAGIGCVTWYDFPNLCVCAFSEKKCRETKTSLIVEKATGFTHQMKFHTLNSRPMNYA
ncbi:hypothetical protein Q8A67_023210 [Cirrhinus molitorella]|uniref:Uncharacterized protein n=1 Tax=Cirrhinus molitorella TaxID=172907 RepID=A0AA88TE36_9TELE|nr:hypothetical protein Q8A67_023210 [Cirrhinus molitorella]